MFLYVYVFSQLSSHVIIGFLLKEVPELLIKIFQRDRENKSKRKENYLATKFIRK